MMLPILNSHVQKPQDLKERLLFRSLSETGDCASFQLFIRFARFYYMRKIFAHTNMANITVAWEVKPRSVIHICQYFGEMDCPYIEGSLYLQLHRVHPRTEPI